MLCNYINKIRYSIKPRKRKYAKGYGVLSYAKYIVENLSGNYGQELVDETENLLQMHLRLQQKEQFKIA